jgi:hypothetical protein
MASPCSADAARLSEFLHGPDCHNAPAIVNVRSPFDLMNWTLPIVELVMVVGAGLALYYAIRRWRQRRDPLPLVLYFSSLVYLLVIEPPLYFPEKFGLQDQVGIVFVHNVFTVNFMYDRLPLYIAALYPAMVTLAFGVVRALGVFERRGAVVGAISVGFVHCCFYEIFDQLGPQLRWWDWNLENQAAHPLLGSAPMSSVAIFAAFGPIALAFCAYKLVGVRVARGDRLAWPSLTWRTLAIGVLTPIGAFVLGIPASVFKGHTGAQAVVYSLELLLIAGIAGWALVAQWLELRRSGGAEQWSPYPLVFGSAFLLVFAFIWITGLPTFFDATNGVSKSGALVGNLPFTLLCFALAGTCLYAVFTAARSSVEQDLPHEAAAPSRKPVSTTTT